MRYEVSASVKKGRTAGWELYLEQSRTVSLKLSMVSSSASCSLITDLINGLIGSDVDRVPLRVLLVHQ